MNTLIVAGSMVLVAIVGTAIIKFLEKKKANSANQGTGH